MNWKFLNTGFSSGKFNMEFDRMLAAKVKPGEAYLRLYRWKPYCISLGANQSEDSLLTEKIKSDGIDVVKRPTGGRAILHSEELTYSFVCNSEGNISAKDLYREINLALKKGLAFYNNKLNALQLEHKQPDFPEFYKQEKGVVCFAVAAKDEINYNDKKLVGSAQRRIGSSLLQHGSILCGDYHQKIVDYLNLPQESLLKIKDEVERTTISLGEILNEEIDYNKLEDAIKYGFENHFNINFDVEPLEVSLNGTESMRV